MFVRFPFTRNQQSGALLAVLIVMLITAATLVVSAEPPSEARAITTQPQEPQPSQQKAGQTAGKLAPDTNACGLGWRLESSPNLGTPPTLLYAVAKVSANDV